MAVTTSLASSIIMSLATQCPTLSDELRDWLATCPDSGRFLRIVEYNTYLNCEDGCHECGDRMLRVEMRQDFYSPFGAGELVCRSCYEYFDEGTIASPNHRAPPWDEQPLPPAPEVIPSRQVNLFDVQRISFPAIEWPCTGKAGVTPPIQEIWYHDKCIGTVSSYNALHHTGYVTLHAFPNSSEWGTLGPETTVRIK